MIKSWGDNELLTKRIESMPSSITVAICTYKRYPLLKKLIGSLANQTLTQASFKVLVVDNNDDPSEREQFANEVEGSPGVTVIASSPPGLSRARNVAIEKCNTEYIVFIDDDAFPEPGWLDALLRGFEKSSASVLAGPIAPVWPKPRPHWLPDKYVACLTILDHGSEDKLLSENEFAYGTNMAFKTSVLREVGGFNSTLGRSGSKTLISDEEIEIQIALRARGHKIFYASGAKVLHRVHENRLNRNYFRARMAWQAVSSLMHESPLWHPAHSMQELARASRTLGMDRSLADLFSSRDATTFSAQIDLIYHLFLLVLNANGEHDDAFEQQFTALENVTEMSYRAEPASSPAFFAIEQIRRSAPIALDTRHLFVEGRSGHAFLFDVYGSLPHSQLLSLPTDTWGNCDADLHFLEASLSPNLETVTFLSLDPLAYGPSSSSLIGLLDRLETGSFGILHRLPWTPEHAQSLREVARRLSKVIVLAEGMGRKLREEYGIDNIAYLPLHPTHHLYLGRDQQSIRDCFGIKPNQTVFSTLGEARKGKGIELLLESLKHLTQADRDRMFFLFAGRAKDIDARDVERQLRISGCFGLADLRQSENPLQFAVLSEREFGRYVAVSDVGLLLYQGDQRSCMSGMLPNYVWGGMPVIATANSIVGEQVLKYGIGMTLELETPQAVADVLSGLSRQQDGSKLHSDKLKSIRKSLSPSIIVESLKEILEPARPTCRQLSESIDFKKELTETTAFDRYLSNMPMLHSWDGGKTWNSGGFDQTHLKRLHTFLKSNLPSSPVILETGAGNSTISFLFLEPKRLVSIAPDAQLFDRICSYCEAERISLAALEANVDGSEWVLPRMATEIRNEAPILDFALIDGSHNWPMVFVDFCFVNQMLKTGGYIMIDDIQLHSVKELARMLSEQPGFELALDLGKSLVFRRTSTYEYGGDWASSPYIVRKTNEYSKTINPYSL